MNTRRVCQWRASKSLSTASSCARASSGRIASTAETIRSTRAEAAPFAPQPIWNGRTTTRDGSACRRSAWLNNSSKGGAPAAGFGTYGGANERYASARSGFATALGRASCRERVCQYVSISVFTHSYKQQHLTHEQEDI